MVTATAAAVPGDQPAGAPDDPYTVQAPEPQIRPKGAAMNAQEIQAQADAQVQAELDRQLTLQIAEEMEAGI